MTTLDQRPASSESGGSPPPETGSRQTGMERFMTWGAITLAIILSLGALLTAASPQTESPGTGVTTVTGGVVGTIEVVAGEFFFEPSTIDVEQPGRYEIILRNGGSIVHDLTAGGVTITAAAGETATGIVEVPAEGLAVVCSIPGHSAAGMIARIVVAGTAGGYAQKADRGTGAPPTGIEPDPNAPAYQLHDSRAPARGEGPGITLVPGGAASGGDLIEVELVVEEKLMTVAEGYSQMAWTYGGTVPGPVIRTRVGDTVRVHLVISKDAQLPHSIDFHASQVAMNEKMRTINPGEELIYEFTTDYAGVWMYHCGTPPVLHHIANGMYGMLIVEPAEGLAPVAEEFAMVQSEWYLGPQGETTDLAKADQGAPSPDLILFNGVARQYADNPIQIPTGEEVRLFVLNAGPSIDSSFHVVGTIFDTVVKEGVELRRGNPGSYGSQAVDLAPAQGAIIEMKAVEDGRFAIVTHAFNFPGRGALGFFQAGDGDPSN